MNYCTSNVYQLSKEGVERYSENNIDGLNFCIVREIGTRPWKPVTLDCNGCVKTIEMVDTGRIIGVKDLNCSHIQGREYSYIMFTLGELSSGTVKEVKKTKGEPVQVEVEPLYLVLERSPAFERASIAYRGRQCTFTLEEAKQMVAELCLVSPVDVKYELYKFHGTATPVVTTVIEIN